MHDDDDDDDDVLVRKVVCVGVVNASDIEDVASTNAAAKDPILLCDDGDISMC